MRQSILLWSALQLCECVELSTSEAGSLLQMRLDSTQVMSHRDVETNVQDGSATVGFSFNGKFLLYNMTASSVYDPTASISLFTDDGIEEIDIGETRTFRSQEPGRAANVLIHEDGTVSGVFQVNNQLVLVEESLSHEGTHDVSLADVPELGGSKHLKKGNLVMLGVDAEHHPAKEHPPAVDNTNIESDGHGHEIAKDPDDLDKNDPPHAKVVSAQAKTSARIDSTWGGARFFPGCYTGDDKEHTITVNAIVDKPGFDLCRTVGRCRALVETAISNSNIIYENQMNVKIVLGKLKIYTTDAGAPNYAQGCNGNPSSQNPVSPKLDELTAAQRSLPDQGAAVTHLFTGCGLGYGVVGVAYIGTMCNLGRNNLGVNQLKVRNLWHTFAHELGHNFAARHSFEDGQGRTGGIMDYGPPYVNGVAQFNSKYRRSEMCRAIDIGLRRCGSFLKVSPNIAPAAPAPAGGGGGGGGAAPAPSPAAPAPSPPTAGPNTAAEVCTIVKDFCNANKGTEKQICPLLPRYCRILASPTAHRRRRRGTRRG